MAFKEQKSTRKREMADMMAENAQAQFLTKVAQEKEKEEDKRLQKEIMKVLDIQQNKEANDAKHREIKQRVFVDKMANEVLTKVVEKNRKEQEIIQKYTEERLMKEKLEEERRFKKQKQEQMEMKEYLARQVKDKVKKEEIDKEVIEEQANLWRMDRETFAKEEADLSKKLKDLSMHNSQLLQKQIEESQNKKKGMDDIEYGINKTYLKGIRAKKHEILKEGV